MASMRSPSRERFPVDLQHWATAAGGAGPADTSMRGTNTPLQAARELFAPLPRPRLLIRLEVVVLLHEEALRFGNERGAVVAQLARDAFRCPPGDRGREVEAGV